VLSSKWCWPPTFTFRFFSFFSFNAVPLVSRTEVKPPPPLILFPLFLSRSFGWTRLGPEIFFFIPLLCLPWRREHESCCFPTTFCRPEAGRSYLSASGFFVQSNLDLQTKEDPPDGCYRASFFRFSARPFTRDLGFRASHCDRPSRVVCILLPKTGREDHSLFFCQILVPRKFFFLVDLPSRSIFSSQRRDCSFFSIRFFPFPVRRCSCSCDGGRPSYAGYTCSLTPLTFLV